MSPLDLFLFVLMAGLGLASLFLVGLGLWVVYLALKGLLVQEPK